MIGARRLLAMAIAFFLASNSAPGGSIPSVLGIVVHADRARLGSEAASEGTTIYDGDRISTGLAGSLGVRIGDAMLDLAEESSAIVHQSAGASAKAFEAELASGSVVLSVSGGTAEIVASTAHIRPIAEARGVVQVKFVGPLELIVFARLGPAQISYRGESETIAEGKCYRVLLNAAADDPSAGPGARKPGKHGKALALIAVGAAAITGIALWKTTGGGTQRGVESPDKP